VCTYGLVACKDPTADNYYALADVNDPAKCMYGGCTNPDASNYNPSVSWRAVAMRKACGPGRVPPRGPPCTGQS